VGAVSFSGFVWHRIGAKCALRGGSGHPVRVHTVIEAIRVATLHV
jgi:hypothetical protein